MNEKIEEIVKRASEPLRGDWALEQEVAQELRTHLEDKCAELEGEGSSPAESTAKAVNGFGDPDEVGKGLLQANFHKMKLRGRLKTAMRILALPLLLLAVWATLDFSVLAGIGTLLKFLGVNDSEQAARITSFCEWWSGKPQWSDEQKLWSSGFQTGEGRKLRRELAERHPGDPVVIANYAIPAFDGEDDERLEALDFAIRHDPDNALYRYLRAATLIGRCTDYEKLGSAAWVTDREKLDRAMAEFLEAAGKPKCSNYLLERLDKIAGLYPDDDFRARVRFKEDVWTMLLPELAPQRTLASYLAAYAKILAEEGKHAAAEKILDAWLPFSRHITRSSNTLIAVLVDNGVLEIFEKQLPEIYEKIGKPEKAAFVSVQAAAIRKPVAEWRSFYRDKKAPGNIRAQEDIRLYGGFFSGMAVRAPDGSISAEQLKADRTLSYAIADHVVLLVFCLVSGGSAVLFAVWLLVSRLAGCKAHFVWFSRREYLKLGFLGILLPLACYLLWIPTDALGGRDYSLTFHQNGFLFQALVFIAVVPLWFLFVFRRILERRARVLSPEKRSLPFVTQLATLIPLWLVFMLVVGGLMRISVNRELNWGMKHDNSLFSGILTAPEDRAWQVLRQDLLDGFDRAEAAKENRD